MKKYGVIGYPIGHTFSPAYFAKKFDKLGIKDCIYSAYEIVNLTEIRSFVQTNQLSGFNVTIPYKQNIIHYLDAIDPVAAEINAVNVVKLENGKLKGFNTDYLGFKESLSPLVHSKMSAFIFGSGGSSAAIKYVLKELHIDFEIISRDNSKGRTYASITESDIESNELLINTTPLGMQAYLNQCVDIPFHAISNKNIGYDLVYNPLETEFLKRCKNQGATTKNGLEMLELQADKSWDIWIS